MTYERYEFLIAMVRGDVPHTTATERLGAADELIADRPSRRSGIERLLRA